MRLNSLVSLEEAVLLFEKGLNENKLVIAVGNCFVKYDGRAASKLSEGDRLVVIKPDGTFLVHQRKGMAAINYQGPGSKASACIRDNALLLESVRRKPLKESITVSFKEISFVDCFGLKDDSKLKLFGSERQLSGLLMQDLNLLEKGLTPLKQESEVRKGTIDILARDSKNRLVVIEVKRRNAGLDSVTQLDRYVKELRERKNEAVRGMLCSPSITPNALTMLEKQGLEFFRLDYEIGNPSARIKGLEKKQKNLSEYSAGE